MKASSEFITKNFLHWLPWTCWTQQQCRRFRLILLPWFSEPLEHGRWILIRVRLLFDALKRRWTSRLLKKAERQVNIFSSLRVVNIFLKQTRNWNQISSKVYPWSIQAVEKRAATQAGNLMQISILLRLLKNLSNFSPLSMILTPNNDKFFFTTKAVESSNLRKRKPRWSIHMPYGQDLNKFIWVNNENSSVNRKISLVKYRKLAKEFNRDLRIVSMIDVTYVIWENVHQNLTILESPRHKQQQKSPSCKQQ